MSWWETVFQNFCNIFESFLNNENLILGHSRLNFF